MLIETMPAETLMLISAEEGSRKGLYAHVDKILAQFVSKEDIEYVDDPDWVQFPEVASALTEAGYNIKDHCLNVAVCGVASVWAAATGNKWKSRNAAAKVALATMLALRAADSGEAPDTSSFPEFEAFIEEAASIA